MVKEIITNNVQKLDSGNTFGNIRHAFVSPETHWTDGVVCEVIVDIYNGKANRIRLSYGSGGHNKEASDADIAYAMSRAFQLAGDRLQQLYKEHGYEAS